MSCWNIAILQIYFCVYSKYEVYFKCTFGDILISKVCDTEKVGGFHVFFLNPSIYTWGILFELMYFFKLRSIIRMDFLNLCIYSYSNSEVYIPLVDFLNKCIYFQNQVYLKYKTQKYKGITFSKLMYFFSILEVYLNIDVFILKLKNILEVDFQNLCIYLQTLKYTWSRLSILMYLFWNSEVYLK